MTPERPQGPNSSRETRSFRTLNRYCSLDRQEWRSERRGWDWGMKDESGVTFRHTGLLHITADFSFLEGSRREGERGSEIGDNEARKEEKSEESCCARPQERKERREEVSPWPGQHTPNTTQLFPILFCFLCCYALFVSTL